MRNIGRLVIVIVSLLLFVGIALADHHAVKINEKEGVGRYLTDAEGMTIYWFMQDTPGKSVCAGPCSAKWPPYYREIVAAPAGILADEFVNMTRADGAKQTTFRGYPLYYRAGDKTAGDTGGQGLNDVWFVINPDTFPPQ
ncbi:MAG: hypothetical protein KJ950_09715 [Proteobacteria bacterium]|nr:hypothetical protein [Pseudomonadota bacterium]MBU1688931.1 hypothetical protein [Pseudomonadota bacterium]